MEVLITGRHMPITDAIRDYAKTRVNKLSRYFDRVRSVDVMAEKVDPGFKVEAHLHMDRGSPLIAHADGLDLYACIDAVVDKAERQLTDLKDRLRDHKH